jgi:hypothetical protein
MEKNSDPGCLSVTLVPGIRIKVISWIRIRIRIRIRIKGIS